MNARSQSLDVLGISHVGFSVTRLEQFIDSWGAVLGIDDWVIREDVDELGTQVAGISQDTMSVRLGYARIGGVCLELVETVAGQTCHAQSAAITGPGLHHIAFWVSNLDDQVRTARDLGLTIAMAPSALVARLRGPAGAAAELAARSGQLAGEVSLYAFLALADAGLNFTLELLDVRLLADYQRLTGEKPTRPPGAGTSGTGRANGASGRAG
jgi:catechol 2,3-dioxygenase-like lactoylglutathione lyase family enzyme